MSNTMASTAPASDVGLDPTPSYAGPARTVNLPTRSGRSALIVGLLAFVVFLPSVQNGFAFDDERDIQDNPTIVDASGPIDVLLSPYRGDVPPGRSPYRPLTSLSFWMNGKLVGDGPESFHLVNVLLHTLASVLVVYVLADLGAPDAGVLAGGLVFAVHPVHVEAVANVVGRADVLMTIACLVGVLAFLARGLGPVVRACLVAGAYAAALGAKENGVVLPGLLALLLVLPRATSSERGAAVFMRRELLVLTPTVVVLAGYLALRERILGTLVQLDTAPYITLLPASERVATAVANLLQIGRLLVFPVDLAADYGPDIVTPVGFGSVRFWLGAVTVGLSVALTMRLYRRARLGAVALGWIALSVLVVSNLVIPIGVWVAERTLYLPSVGVAVGAGALIPAVAAVSPRATRAVWACLAVVILAATWRSVDRIPSWSDTQTVLRTLTREHPESFRSQWWLAQSLTEAGDYDSGLRWFEQARKTNPNDLRLALDHARALLLAGRPAEAEALAQSLPPADPARFVYLAQSKIMTGRPEEAREDVRAGLDRFPRDPRLLGQARELGVAAR